jgi:hypothetical protein
VTVLHSGDLIERGKISEIIAEYRQRFDQEGLLGTKVLDC